MTASTSSKPYTPVLPLDIQSSSVLSQDVITSASILVDSTSPAPVAAFTNPASGEAEALAIVNKQICHITRDRQTDSGWRAIPLFGGQAAEQVAAAVPFQTTAYGFFIDGGGQLHSTKLESDGKTWSAPVAVPGGLMSHPRVAYTSNGAVVIYGVSTKGDLATAHQTGMTDPFTAMVHPVQGALAGDDFQLCMIDEVAFTILANVNAKAYTITGDITQTNIVGPALAPQFTEGLEHVALGYAAPVGLSPTAIFLVVAKDKAEKCSALHCWSQVGGSDPVVQKVANGSISLATGHVSLDNSLHVYAIDNNLGLWVLHQSARQPWREDGTPNWAPFLPLDKGIGRVVSDINPAAVPSLFAIDGGDYSLRLHALDPGSRMWKSQKILQHKAEAYEVARHRAEVRILDGNARALPNHPVTVKVEKGSSAMEVWAGGRLYLIDEKGTTLTTDITGKLTVAIIATEHGLACPNLVIGCDGLPEPKTIRPAGGLHEYLSGKGTLNPTNPPNRGGGPLPQFDCDGQTLKTATVDGKLLAPGASDSNSDPKAAANVANAIQHGALVALGNPPPGVHGFGGSLLKGHTSFEVFHTPQALQAHCEEHRLTNAHLDSFWDELKHFFADIFEGIKNLVIKIAKFVVRVAESIVQFTLDIAEFAGQLLHLDISGIEKAASFMHGFFNSVDAGIDKVVAWLEALFDFGAIWRTKMAIQKAVEGFPPYVKQLAGEAQTIADGWFGKQEEAVNKAFDDLQNKYAGQSFGQMGHWQDPCAPPSSSPIAGAGAATPSDFANNPHHNWLHDKVTSYPPETPDVPSPDSLEGLWQTVANHLKESGTEFYQALDEFRDATWTMISDPASFATKAVPEFIEMVRHLALAALELMDAIVDAVAAVIATSVDLVDDLAKAELPLGFLNTLWKWMAEAAGYPDDATLNLYALSALLAALPATLIYKLVEGVDHEPFPPGKALAPAQLGAPWPWPSRLTSDIVRINQARSAIMIDVIAPKSVIWFTAANALTGAAVYLLRGYPSSLKDLGSSLVLLCGFLRPLVRISAMKILNDDNRANDLAAGVGTLYGLGCLAYGIYLDKTQPQRQGLQIANILVPLPNVFAFLTLSSIRENPDAAPLAIGGNVVFDLVGYVGGGVELMIDTIQAKPKHAVTAA